MSKQFLLVSLLGFSLSSCEKQKQCTYNCQNGSIHVYAVGYTLSETDTIIVKRYDKGSQKTDSSLLSVETLLFMYPSGNDSLRHILKLDSWYDYEVNIPATNQHFLFTEIKTQGKSEMIYECDKMRGCINEIETYQINGVQVAGRAFLRK